jgi:hypothetical protein
MKKVNFALLILCSMIFLSSCHKEDRLAASTFDFRITPPAAQVVRNNTLTLTARGNSGGGSFSVSPTWSVSDEALGSLSTSIGSSVEFQALALGDVTVTATYDGIQTTSQIAIVTYIPNSNTFDVYNDDGLPSGAGLDSDIFTSGGLSLAEISTGYTPEGVKYQRATNAPDDAFWGVTLDDANMGLTQNLSSFSGGTLKFALRLGRTLGAGESIRIDIQDTGFTGNFSLVSGSNGYSRLDTNWQEISIPISSFAGVNLSQIKVPFAVVLPILTSTLTFDVDAVRWEE